MNRLKFQNQQVLSRFFAMKLGKILPILKDNSYDGILMIPSHKKSKLNRPYLPTDTLAKRLSRKLNIPIYHWVEKKSSKHQSSLTRQDRFFHAGKAYSLKKNTFQSTNLRLLLIDDVFTTGASLNEVSRLLLEKEVGSITTIIASRPLEGIEI